MEDAGAMEARAVVAMAAVTLLRGDWCVHGAVSGSRSGSSEGGAEVSRCCCRCGGEYMEARWWFVCAAQSVVVGRGTAR